jgi:hypothetical protein
MKATWIETFLEGVTDKYTGQPIFKELVWFVYKVSGVMSSDSACDHFTLKGGIHSVRSWLRGYTNLVLRDSLDASLHHL